MRKIRVFLQYPWKFPDSPYYNYLVKYPPKKIEYLNVKNQKGVITKKKKFLFSSYLKKVRHYAHELRLPFPNSHRTKRGNYDLIHCAHCLSKNKDMPWIADFESYWQLWLSGRSTKMGKKWVSKILSRKNCKKIIAWTNMGRDQIIKISPNIQNKIEVIYPAVPTQKLLKTIKKRNKEINLLFVARYFYGKGGMHALEAIDELTKRKKNVKGYIISSVPKEVLDKYAKNKKIKFIDIMPQEKLISEIYPSSDIYIYPGYSDTFGFSMLEAMSFGIPIITVEGDVKDEIIDEGKTGFIIPSKNASYKENIRNRNKEVIKGIIDATLRLIDNPRLRTKMGKNCIKTIQRGKFSIKERNKKFERIYSEAIK
jgi:glycosyltransferase involved in cell wall biosynthesis